MELFLNVFWLLLALLSVGLWWTQWSRAGSGRGERGASLPSAISLSCALLVLFPVISLTDDLHAVPALAEETRSPRRLLQNFKGSQADPDPDKQVAPFANTVLPNLFSVASVVVGRLAPLDASSPQMAPEQTPQGRAPPRPSSLALW
jgi:hypothetical protein